ncbi:MAG: hypothetical protein Q8L29_04165 [archaeon]|nr:hypothetical protein [archaeon]
MKKEKNKDKIMKEKKQEEKPKKKDGNREIIWVLVVMGVLILSIVVTYSLIQSMKTFSSDGLTFTKEKHGNIIFYHYYYSFEKAGQVYTNNVYLRNDPRENEVPITGNGIFFYQGKANYLSINSTNLGECPDASIAVSELTKLFTNNLMEVRPATLDKTEAQEKDIRYASCATEKDSVVVEVFEGEETKITSNGYCYKIEVANCEILKATEKFIVQSIVDAKIAPKTI